MVTVWMFVAVACSELVAASTSGKSTWRRKEFDFSPLDCNVEFCTKCESNNSYRCATCHRGMSLNPKDGTCILCAVECETCDPMNSGRCTQCSAGFSLQSDGTCNSDIPFAPGESSARTAFDFSPLDCNVEFCAKCEPNNSDQCATCQHSMSFNPKDGTCDFCASGCETCDPKNRDRCTQCSVGYSLQSDGTCNSIAPIAFGVIIGLSVGIPALCCLLGGLGFWFYMAKRSPKRRPMAGATPYGAAPPYTNAQPQGAPYTNAQPHEAPYANTQPHKAPYTNTDLQGAPYTNIQPQTAVPYVNTKM